MRFFTFIIMLLVSACASIGETGHPSFRAIVIQMSDGSNLPDRGTVKLSIYDGALMDVAMKPIYARTYQIPDNTSVVLYQTLIVPTELLRNISMPSYSIRVEKNGELLAINKNTIPVNSSNELQFLKIESVKLK